MGRPHAILWPRESWHKLIQGGQRGVPTGVELAGRHAPLDRLASTLLALSAPCRSSPLARFSTHISLASNPPSNVLGARKILRSGAHENT